MAKFGSSGEHVVVSVEDLRSFISDKIEEVAARVVESKAQAAQFLHQLKGDLISDVQQEISGFSERARDYADARSEELLDRARAYSEGKTVEFLDRARVYHEGRTEELLGRAKAYSEEKSEELLSRAKVYAEEKSEALAEKLGGLFSKLEQISLQVEEVAARAEARFDSIEKQLAELHTDHSIVDAGAADDNLDLSSLEDAAVSDDSAGLDILDGGAGDDVLVGEDDDISDSILPVGVVGSDGVVVDDGALL